MRGRGAKGFEKASLAPPPPPPPPPQPRQDARFSSLETLSCLSRRATRASCFESLCMHRDCRNALAYARHNGLRVLQNADRSTYRARGCSWDKNASQSLSFSPTSSYALVCIADATLAETRLDRDDRLARAREHRQRGGPRFSRRSCYRRRRSRRPAIRARATSPSHLQRTHLTLPYTLGLPWRPYKKGGPSRYRFLEHAIFLIIRRLDIPQFGERFQKWTRPPPRTCSPQTWRSFRRESVCRGIICREHTGVCLTLATMKKACVCLSNVRARAGRCRRPRMIC